MLTQKGLDKVGNGELEDYYLRGKLKFVITTKKGKWFQGNKITIEYKLLDIDTNELLANGINNFGFKIGDSFDIELPDIKKKVILSAS